MEYLFDPVDLESASDNTLFPLKCKNCHQAFAITKKKIKYILYPSRHKTGDFCSFKCKKQHQVETGRVVCVCVDCGKKISKQKSDVQSNNVFCNQSCAAKYNNKHKKFGTRRSKLELWLEQQMNFQFPELEIIYNGTTIGSELDIYIPSLKLAFELNGIFHYKPIYGDNKLKQIQANDQNKFEQCQKHGISLCVLDTSSQKYFKPKTSQKYFDIISNIICACINKS